MNRPLSIFTYWIFCLAALLALTAGCVPTYTPPAVADNAPQLSTALAQTAAHLESADRLTSQATPHADAAGRTFLAAAHGEHAAAAATNHEAQSQLGKVETENATLRNQVTLATAAHDQLAGRWYVRWGVRIDRWLWGSAITLALASIGVVVLEVFFPQLGLAAWLTKIHPVQILSVVARLAAWTMGRGKTAG